MSEYRMALVGTGSLSFARLLFQLHVRTQLTLVIFARLNPQHLQIPASQGVQLIRKIHQ